MEITGSNILLAESKSTLESYSQPANKSSQDGIDFKYKDKRLSLWMARYSYAPLSNKHNSRDFCVKMVDIARKGVVYRKEDIIKMGNDGINSELAPSGTTNYSIWLFKGGAVCHHFWLRRIYVRKWNAIQIPTWLQYVSDLPLPNISNKYYRVAAYLLINSMAIDKVAKKNLFYSVTNIKGAAEKFVSASAKNYFTRYIAGLDIPAPIKTVIFQRFGKTYADTIRFINGLLRGRMFPSEKINNSLLHIPDFGDYLDVKDAGKLFDAIEGVTRGLMRRNDRKIGFPKSRSTTNALENEEEIGTREARARAIHYPENDIRVGMKPVNLPDKGFMSGKGKWARQRAGKLISRGIKKAIKSSVKSIFKG